MRLLLNSADHYGYLRECVAAKPRSIFLASYGLYAGILSDGRDTQTWGEKYKSQTRELLESMRNIENVRILVGLYEYKSCRGKQSCLSCERKYVMDLIRHMNHAEKFTEFQWRVASESHVKCALFTYPETNPAPLRGVAGGRNFNDSSWADITVELDKMSILRVEEHVEGIWKTAKVLTGKVLGEVLEDQGISQLTINQIIAGA
jgi:hypothetical protein